MLIMSESEKKDKTPKTKIIVKTPTQERSRQTVATILDACARLLISEGFYAITTDKIAKEADVSIGSLYQFFGNKESVVQALVKNIIEEDKRIMTERMRPISPLPPEQRIRAMIEVAIDIIRNKSELRSKLSTIQYYVADSSYMSESIRFYKEVVQYNLPQLPGRDMDNVAYVMVNTFIGLTNTIAIDRPSAIHDPNLVSEISRILYNYLELNVSVPQPTIGKTTHKGDFI